MANIRVQLFEVCRDKVILADFCKFGAVVGCSKISDRLLWSIIGLPDKLDNIICID